VSRRSGRVRTGTVRCLPGTISTMVSTSRRWHRHAGHLAGLRLALFGVVNEDHRRPLVRNSADGEDGPHRLPVIVLVVHWAEPLPSVEHEHVIPQVRVDLAEPVEILLPIRPAGMPTKGFDVEQAMVPMPILSRRSRSVLTLSSLTISTRQGSTLPARKPPLAISRYRWPRSVDLPILWWATSRVMFARATHPSHNQLVSAEPSSSRRRPEQ